MEMQGFAQAFGASQCPGTLKSAISALSNDLPQNEILHFISLAIVFWLIPGVSNLDSWINKHRVWSTVFAPRNQ